MILNEKGFTLMELLAVIAIIAILGLIAVPSVLNTINTSKTSSYQILVENIYTASKSLYEEIEYVGNDNIKYYNAQGVIENEITITTNGDGSKSITVNLQTLVNNGFLTGTTNPEPSLATNNNSKIITNPKSDQDIGECSITITRTKENGKVKYSIKNNSSANTDCPTDEEYEEGVK